MSGRVVFCQKDTHCCDNRKQVKPDPGYLQAHDIRHGIENAPPLEMDQWIRVTYNQNVVNLNIQKLFVQSVSSLAGDKNHSTFGIENRISFSNMDRILSHRFW